MGDGAPTSKPPSFGEEIANCVSHAVGALAALVAVAGWLWLLAGGLAYTAGIAFYAAERVRYGHLVWHVFVLMGTACHFCAVLWYAA